MSNQSMPRLLILWATTAITVLACIWDGRTLGEEKKSRPDLANIILNAGKPKPADPTIRQDIDRLRALPQPDNVDWINNLAGAFIRSGQPAEAVKLLEPARERFPDNYGIHANLGTSYHLLGRYADAEREIAKDLEINPDAHFGLEKYHLALLQYLMRDQDYQRRHLYIDEWSEEFFWMRGERLRGLRQYKVEILPANHKPETPEQIESLKKTADPEWRARFPNEKVVNDVLESAGDLPPAYRFKWDLAADTNLTRGVMYMAELNPDQPAAMVMAGVIAAREGSYNLAIAAYQRAIGLGSPQADILKWHITALESHVAQSLSHRNTGAARKVGGVAIGVALLGLFAWTRKLRKEALNPSSSP